MGVHKQKIQCYGTRIGVGSAENLRADRNTIVQARARESTQRMAGLLQKWLVSPFRTPNSNDLTTLMPHFTQTTSSANITAVRIKVPTQEHWKTHSNHIQIIADGMSQHEREDQDSPGSKQNRCLSSVHRRVFIHNLNNCFLCLISGKCMGWQKLITMLCTILRGLRGFLG